LLSLTHPLDFKWTILSLPVVVVVVVIQVRGHQAVVAQAACARQAVWLWRLEVTP